MLQTIRIPKNMYFLTEKLPKPNYTPVKIIQIDKMNFFNTIGVQNDNKNEDSNRLP
jgi:NIMA (never in mitosis gene a)-related kinase